MTRLTDRTMPMTSCLFVLCAAAMIRSSDAIVSTRRTTSALVHDFRLRGGGIMADVGKVKGESLGDAMLLRRAFRLWSHGLPERGCF